MDKSPATNEKCPKCPCPVTVMVRAYAGEPVRLTAHSVAGGHVVVAGDDPRKAIGFPVGEVFEFEGKLFADLVAAYERADRIALSALWDRATPLMHQRLN
jgi:hypothetical protein